MKERRRSPAENGGRVISRSLSYITHIACLPGRSVLESYGILYLSLRQCAFHAGYFHSWVFFSEVSAILYLWPWLCSRLLFNVLMSFFELHLMMTVPQFGFRASNSHFQVSWLNRVPDIVGCLSWLLLYCFNKYLQYMYRWFFVPLYLNKGNICICRCRILWICFLLYFPNIAVSLNKIFFFHFLYKLSSRAIFS